MTCRFEGCKTKSQYGFLHRNVGTHCRVHKEAGMINISRKCQIPDCAEKATFRGPRDFRVTRCFLHRKFGTISATSFRCPALGCLNQDRIFVQSRNKIGCCYLHQTIELPLKDKFFLQLPDWKSSIEFQESFLLLEPICFDQQPTPNKECEPGVNCLADFWLGKSWKEMYCKFHFLMGVESESEMEISLYPC